MFDKNKFLRYQIFKNYYYYHYYYYKRRTEYKKGKENSKIVYSFVLFCKKKGGEGGFFIEKVGGGQENAWILDGEGVIYIDTDRFCMCVYVYFMYNLLKL